MRAAAVGPRRVALVAIAIVAPLVLGGAAAIAVDPIVGGGAALVLALFEIGIRALIAQPRCKACGWVAPPPRPKAAPASAVLPTPAP